MPKQPKLNIFEFVAKDKEEFEAMMPFELCRRGHQRQDHEDTFARGHGRCLYGKFNNPKHCQKFTWNRKYIQ